MSRRTKNTLGEGRIVKPHHYPETQIPQDEQIDESAQTASPDEAVKTRRFLRAKVIIPTITAMGLAAGLFAAESGSGVSRTSREAVPVTAAPQTAPSDVPSVESTTTAPQKTTVPTQPAVSSSFNVNANLCTPAIQRTINQLFGDTNPCSSSIESDLSQNIFDYTLSSESNGESDVKITVLGVPAGNQTFNTPQVQFAPGYQEERPIHGLECVESTINNTEFACFVGHSATVEIQATNYNADNNPPLSGIATAQQFEILESVVLSSMGA